MFSPNEFINCIYITDSVILDHRIITANKIITISQSSPPCQTMNYTCKTLELLGFMKTAWAGVCASIKSVNWKELLHDCIPSKYISVIIETLGNLCSIHVLAKRSKKYSVSKFHRAGTF